VTDGDNNIDVCGFGDDDIDDNSCDDDDDNNNGKVEG
jgi:hypothetical protein